ncbi:Glycosyl hydrolases family 2, sugar binding domain [Cyclobacterium lianum]|uniref:Glycosyl hydrolases family 2, sugar binding domain n=1 Tax=Cyclobacterium lianum TaxID=388280 RepID=A0A1M7JWF7_9BACT|nr:glycosyl hydrolase [Cyclobacterium lianum]SHM57366.1 Glycosyl hydrolases family 2, sugar binding domain [Cyclobacterium lianum]
MFRNRKALPSIGILMLLVSAAVVGLNGCEPIPERTNSVRAGEWPEVTQTSKPWTRWWWMGNAVDKENLTWLLEEYEDAGLGGLEIAPIYGAKGFEDRFLEHLSPEWMDMLQHTVAKADSLNMGIDLTQGTGWPFGGPMVSPERAAQRMVVQKYSYTAGQGLDRPLVLEDKRAAGLHHGLHTLMAYQGDTVENLSDKVIDSLNLDWNASGQWELIAIFQAQTGQMVKRAAPGGKGFTLDHYSDEAVNRYLDHFEKAFQQDFPGIRSFYNDSFEVYGSDFTADFFEVFEQKRGYDLRDHLPELFAEEPDDTSARLKSDYRETIHEMLLANFTMPWTEWANSHGKKTKNQAHGSPGNLLDLYAAVDIPEGETFGSSYFPIPGIRRDSADIRNVDPDPIMLKFASSAAHLTGKNLVSTETFTWLGEHFKSAFSQAKPELEQAFLAGVNHMFYHGVTYSPEGVDFPGWLFYASLNLNTHNSLWPHFKGFNAYIQRVQSVLQAGTPDHEIMMYWPVYDVWADPEGLSKMLTVHGIDEWLHPTAFYQQSKMLMDKGFGLDFVSDLMIAGLQIENGQYSAAEGKYHAKVLVIPEAGYMPVSTLENIISLAEKGGTVIFQQVPKDVPGFNDHLSRREAMLSLWQSLAFDSKPYGEEAQKGAGKVILTNNVFEALEGLGLQREPMVDEGLKFVRRDLEGEKYYYLVNHSGSPVDKAIPLRHGSKAVVLMEPEQGKVGKAGMMAGDSESTVRVQLDPGQSLVIHVPDGDPEDIPFWRYRNSSPEIVPVAGPWNLEFADGGPEIPDPVTLEEIKPWTDLDDPAALNFSGQAIYENSFELGQIDAGAKYLLELGQVLESARVWINGKEIGYAFGLPFRLDITGFVREGDNDLRIEVANLMANRVRYLDQNDIVWRNYHEINFVNIDYGPFDASGWDTMPSGIRGPVSIEIHH